MANDVFVDGQATANGMSKSVKRNLQADKTQVPTAFEMLEQAIRDHKKFLFYTMPRHISNLLIGKYEPGMSYGTHTDSAIMNNGYRSDISFTLSLSDPNSYEGGELTMETSFGDQRIKLPAGSLVLYPTGGLHRVEEVTSGERVVVVGWLQSRIRDVEKRQILIDMHIARKAYLE